MKQTSTTSPLSPRGETLSMIRLLARLYQPQLQTSRMTVSTGSARRLMDLENGWLNEHALTGKAV